MAGCLVLAEHTLGLDTDSENHGSLSTALLDLI